MKNLLPAIYLGALSACGQVNHDASMPKADTALAGAKLYFCTDDGESTRLYIKKLANGTLQADVTVESAGGSFPTFHYGLQSEKVLNRGSVHEFSGSGFNLVIGVSGASKLAIPKLGIDHQDIDCQQR